MMSRINAASRISAEKSPSENYLEAIIYMYFFRLHKFQIILVKRFLDGLKRILF